ncbi:MAG: glycoside hydrolase family 3 N-terminal domain-containing protein [Bacteroidota bacterium]
MSNCLKYLFLPLVCITITGNSQVEEVLNKSPYHTDWTDFNKNGKQDNYENPKLSTDERIKDLMSQMTLEEKAGQLLTPYGWPMYVRKGNEVVITDELKKDVTQRHIGSLWGFMRADPWTKRTLSTGLTNALSAKAVNQMQRYVIENSRLGIPLILAEECPHGFMAIDGTVFPTSLGLSSTWNPDLIEQMGRAIAKEIRTRGAHIGYGPVLDLARELRWSRVEETFGEDTYLTSRFGVSFVKGLQGANLKSNNSVISTLKAMAGHASPESGHNAAAAHLGERELHEFILPPFEKAVKVGALSVMSSYNEIDGVPSTSNRYILTDLLRDQWGFKGFVVSDLFAIRGLIEHGVAEDLNEAALKAINAGVDSDLGATDFPSLIELIKSGRLKTSVLDEAVKRVLHAKFTVGLFDQPFVDERNVLTNEDMSEHRSLARKIAVESIVLLKNKNALLPLRKDYKSIAVIGPNADNIYNMLGDYTAPQKEDDVVTVLEGIRNHVSKETVVKYAKGCAIRNETEEGFEEATRIAMESDMVIMVMGGSSARDFSSEYEETGAVKVSEDGQNDMESGEGYDRASLNLMGKQDKLMAEIAKLGKPIVLVLIQGRPLTTTWAEQNVPAILNAWYPGMEGGNAIADVLFGDYNPAGRLTVSVPRSIGQIPVYYTAKRLGSQRDYVDEIGKPLYPFGYGLCYTSFEYSDLNVNTKTENGKIEVSVDLIIKNTGSQDGDEVVQLYLKDNVSSYTTPDRTLKAFQRIHLKAGESMKVKFLLNEDSFSLYQGNGKWAIEPGAFTILVGSSSQDIRRQKIVDL